MGDEVNLDAFEKTVANDYSSWGGGGGGGGGEKALAKTRKKRRERPKKSAAGRPKKFDLIEGEH